MKYHNLIQNYFIDNRVAVVLSVQGCPLQCKGCNKSETWDFSKGHEVPQDIRGKIIKLISADGILRDFIVSGGQPLCEENLDFVLNIVRSVRIAYPSIKILIWTGYTYQELIKKEDTRILQLFKNINVLIDGRYDENLKDNSFQLRSSSNQNIIQFGQQKDLF